MPEADAFLDKALIALLLISAAVFVYAAWQGRQPERFTELWMEDHSVQDREAIFSFAIHNREGQAVDYSYAVVVGSKVYKEASLSLADNEKRVIQEKAPLPVPGSGETRVIVQLRSLPHKDMQEIWFWVTP